MTRARPGQPSASPLRANQCPFPQPQVAGPSPNPTPKGGENVGASGNERARARAVEAGMELQTIGFRRQLEDVAERQDLQRLDQLADRLKEVTRRRVERDAEENRDHELLVVIAQELTRLVDGLLLRESKSVSAAVASPDAA